MDRTIHAAAAQQALVCRVDDRIDPLARDVALDDVDPIEHGPLEHEPRLS